MAFYKGEHINQEIFSNNQTSMIDLWEISRIGNSEDVIRFHGGVINVTDSLKFNNKEYFYLPFEVSDLSTRSDGGLSRPTIKLINFQGILSRYIKDKDDLVKAEITRTKTFVRFLDKENFLNYDADIDHWKSMGIDPDPNATLRPDKWIINQKLTENKFFVEFELSNALDFENVSVPRRVILNNYCWWKYRGKGCGYNGGPISDSNNVGFVIDGITNKGLWEAGVDYKLKDVVTIQVDDQGIESSPRNVVYYCIVAHTSSSKNKPSINTEYWARDACNKKISGCKLRFPDADFLPYGGFPGSRLF
jgi:lambda family phage minor tail protein L